MASAPERVPRTTVLLMANDDAGSVRDTATSVLAQTLRDLELLVVDDGCGVTGDGLLADLDDPRVRVHRLRRPRGPARARNSALSEVRSPLVSQLVAGDIWEPDYLEHVLPRFADPGVGLVYTNASMPDHPYGLESYLSNPSVHPVDGFPQLAVGNPVPPSTPTIRVEALQSVGGYAPWLHGFSDYHLHLRLAVAGWRFAYVNRRLVRCSWRDAGRSRGPGRRLRKRREPAMWAAFVLRHPLTRGPRHQLRAGLRKELRPRWRGTRVSPRAGRPRILVVPGSYELLNLGDVAMLQTAISRLEEIWPSPSVDVITSSPARLSAYLPSGVRPLDAEGQRRWSHTRGRAEVEEPAAREFGEALRVADLVLVAGRGGMTDVIEDDTLAILDILAAANHRGTATAMVSQGFGPLESPHLRARAIEVLPHVDLVAVRDAQRSAPLARALGVGGDRLLVAGDDAFEAVRRHRPTPGPVATQLGVNVRIAHYSGLEDGALEVVGRAVREFTLSRGAEPLPIPISNYGHESDLARTAALLGRPAGAFAGASTPAEAVEIAARCRALVSVSYHAALFALAQGVPTVCVAGSPYYRDKLAGLADQFGAGCEVIGLDEPALRDRLGEAMIAAWEAGPDVRGALVQAAERQAQRSASAYARLHDLVERSAASP
jgi:polysaccharide pyruvyl transferase WcaK-like protein